MIAHALLLAATGLLWRVGLRALGRGAMHDMATFALAVMLLGLMLARLVPRVVTLLVAPLLSIAVLRRGRAALGARHWLSLRLALGLRLVRGAACLRARGRWPLAAP